MFKRIKKFFESHSPRYFYQLDEIKYQKTTKSNLYIFKIYGAPTFAKWTFAEIKENSKLRWLINPDDLVKIYMTEEKLLTNKLKYRIKETLRENHYMLAMQEETAILSGDEFFRNSALIEQTNSLDAHKISYHTGFQHGRAFAKEMRVYIESEAQKTECDNVVRLKVWE